MAWAVHHWKLHTLRVSNISIVNIFLFRSHWWWLISGTKLWLRPAVLRLDDAAAGAASSGAIRYATGRWQHGLRARRQGLSAHGLNKWNVGCPNGVVGIALAHARHDGYSLHDPVERAVSHVRVVVPHIVRLVDATFGALPESISHWVKVLHILEEGPNRAFGVPCTHTQTIS